MQFRRITLALAAVAAMSAMSAQAANLVVNGGFEATTNGKGQLGFNTNATGWTNVNGYTFLYTPGTVDSSGANGESGNVSMWGTNNGGLNAIPNSPTGGNFIAFDGGYKVTPLQQTIIGLVVGHANHRFRTIDSMTGFLLQPWVGEWRPQRHPARRIVKIVDRLDLKAMSGPYRGSADFESQTKCGYCAEFETGILA